MSPGALMEMGRYGAYVWPAYGISALVLGGAAVEALLRGRRWRRRAEAAERARRDRA